MNLVVSLIISLIVCIIVYKLFDNYGFKAGLIFKFVVQVVFYLLDGTLAETYNYGMIPLLVFLVIVFVIVLISSAIEYFVYNKTNSFISFLILSEIFESVILFSISSVIAFLIGLII